MHSKARNERARLREEVGKMLDPQGRKRQIKHVSTKELRRAVKNKANNPPVDLRKMTIADYAKSQTGQV